MATTPTFQDYELMLRRAKFPEGASVDVPAYLRDRGNPEAAADWEKMNEEHKDNFKSADDETDSEARFEEGKPADPTKNMSPEDKKKWEESNEEHKDKFKTAGHPIEMTVELGGQQGTWKVFARGPGVLNFKTRDEADTVRQVGEKLVELMGRMSTEAVPPPTNFVQDVVLNTSLWRVTSVAYDPTSARWTMQKGKGHLASDVSGETDSEARFEEGKPADPTEHMSPEDKKKWKEMNEEHGEKFKDATLRHRSTWGPPPDKTAAGGLYGYTKATQHDVEAAVRRIQKQAGAIAKGIWAKDERVASFLTTHAKRANSASARILLAVMKEMGPKVASRLGFGSEHEGLYDAIMLIAEKDDAARQQNNARLAVDRAYEEYRKTQAGNRRNDFRVLQAHLTNDLTKQWALEASDGNKTASHKEAEYGMYGYRAKTARLGLDACSDIRDQAGRIAYDLHARRTAMYDNITGFLKEHSKQSKCRYSNLLLSSYPDRPGDVVLATSEPEPSPDKSGEGQDKAASSVPASVAEWLVWEG
jgi:hypothetical protein